MHATKRTPTGGGTGRRCYVCDEPVRRAKGRHLWQHVRRNPRCAAELPLWDTDLRRRQLKTIGIWINDHVDRLEAIVEASAVSTDHKVGRLRWPGKGRKGHRIIVWATFPGTGGVRRVVFSHNNAETYRHTGEVEEWLERWVAKLCTCNCQGLYPHQPTCRVAFDVAWEKWERMS